MEIKKNKKMLSGIISVKTDCKDSIFNVEVKSEQKSKEMSKIYDEFFSSNSTREIFEEANSVNLEDGQFVI